MAFWDIAGLARLDHRRRGHRNRHRIAILLFSFQRCCLHVPYLLGRCTLFFSSFKRPFAPNKKEGLWVARALCFRNPRGCSKIVKRNERVPAVAGRRCRQKQMILACPPPSANHASGPCYRHCAATPAVESQYTVAASFRPFRFWIQVSPIQGQAQGFIHVKVHTICRGMVGGLGVIASCRCREDSQQRTRIKIIWPCLPTYYIMIAAAHSTLIVLSYEPLNQSIQALKR